MEKVRKQMRLAGICVVSLLMFNIMACLAQAETPAADGDIKTVTTVGGLDNKGFTYAWGNEWHTGLTDVQCRSVFSSDGFSPDGSAMGSEIRNAQWSAGFILDMKQPVRVTHVLLKGTYIEGPGDPDATMQLWGSADGTTWAQVFTSDPQPKWGKTYEADVTGATPYQWWKVWFEVPDGGHGKFVSFNRVNLTVTQ